MTPCLGDETVTAYVEGQLPAEARREAEAAEVLAGKRLFYEAGCIACHIPKQATAQDAADPGVLVLSRFAGAASHLEDALIVNPYDVCAVARALDLAG